MREIRATCQPAEMVEALNALRNDIHARYGYRDGAPRINLGPCGRFARDFRARSNARFRDPVTIAFIMSNDQRKIMMTRQRNRLTAWSECGYARMATRPNLGRRWMSRLPCILDFVLAFPGVSGANFARTFKGQL